MKLFDITAAANLRRIRIFLAEKGLMSRKYKLTFLAEKTLDLNS